MSLPNQIPCECEIHARNVRLFGDAHREGTVQDTNGILGYPTENTKQRCLQKFFCGCQLTKHKKKLNMAFVNHRK